jgi:hypothetical protein
VQNLAHLGFILLKTVQLSLLFLSVSVVSTFQFLALSTSRFSILRIEWLDINRLLKRVRAHGPYPTMAQNLGPKSLYDSTTINSRPKPPAFRKPLPPTPIHTQNSLQELRLVRNHYGNGYQHPEGICAAKEVHCDGSKLFPPPLPPINYVPPIKLESSPEKGGYRSSKDLQYSPQLSRNSVESENKQTSRISRFITAYIRDWWLLEILSWTISAMCIGTIIGILYFYDGKRIPNWRVELFTLNGLISMLAGLAKAALLLPTAEALGQFKWYVNEYLRMFFF